MSTGTTIFVIALVLILAFGATMIWRTFRDTKRRRGSETDEVAIEREVHQNRPRHPGPETDEDIVQRDVRDNRPRSDFDVDGDIKPGFGDTPRHGRHEFR